MTFIVDVLIIAIMALCIFMGYKKGLIGVAVNILGFFIAIIIALVLYAPISNFVINNTSIKPTLQEAISETVASYVIKTEENEQQVEENNSPDVMKEYINEFIEKEKQQIQETERELINNVAGTVADNIIKVAVGITVFLIAKIALIFVKVLAEIITKLPIIGQFDQLGGIIYGVLQGLIIIYIILALISLISPAIADSAILEVINTSIIGKWMYNNNIILEILF